MVAGVKSVSRLFLAYPACLHVRYLKRKATLVRWKDTCSRRRVNTIIINRHVLHAGGCFSPQVAYHSVNYVLDRCAKSPALHVLLQTFLSHPRVSQGFISYVFVLRSSQIKRKVHDILLIILLIVLLIV